MRYGLTAAKFARRGSRTSVGELREALWQGTVRARARELAYAATLERVFRAEARVIARRFREMATGHALTAAAPTAESAMVAVYPTAEQADALAQPNGEPAEILHVTLAFLGEIDPDEADATVAALLGVAAEFGPLAGTVGGLAAFDAAPSDGEPLYPSLALPDVPGLAELRHAVTEALTAAGLPYAQTHGWQPHFTLDYTPEPTLPSLDLLGLPLSFSALSVARGDVATDVPLGEPLLAAGGPPDWSAPHPDEIFDVQRFIAALKAKSAPVRAALLEDVMGGGLDLAGLGFDITNPLVAGMLEKTGAKVTEIADSTRVNVMRTIKAAYDEGLSIPDTAKAIQEGMDAASGARARLIARTEMTGLTQGGADAAMQIVGDELGITYYSRWLTAPGAEYPRHELYDGLDGQTVAQGDLFDVGGFQLAYPGDPDGPIEETANCRCALAWVESPGEVIGVPPPLEEGPPLPEPTATEYVATEGLAAAAAPWIQNLTSLQEDALKAYAGGGGVQINAFLRGETLASEERKVAAKQAGAIKRALAKAETPLPVVVHRGYLDAEAAFGKIDESIIGKTFTEKGFLSTTLDRSALIDGYGVPDATIVDITVPKGYQGALISKLAENPYEAEVLLRQGTTLRVTQAHWDDVLDQWNLKAEVLEPKAPNYVAQVGITPFRAAKGEEITYENTVYAVTKLHPGVTWNVDEGSDSIDVWDVSGDKKAALASLDDVIRYADLRGKDVDWLAGHPITSEDLLARGFVNEVDTRTGQGGGARFVRHPNPELKGESFLAGPDVGKPHDNVIGFYRTKRFKLFQKDVEETAKHYGVFLDDSQRVDGVWQGDIEPSVALRVHDGEVGVRAYVANLARAYDQEGALIFGEQALGQVEGRLGIVATYETQSLALAPELRPEIFQAMKDVGIDGGTILADGRLQVMGAGSEFAARASALQEQLGVPYKVGMGKFDLMASENGDYLKALDKFAGKQAVTEPSLSPMTNDASLSLPGDHALDLSNGEEISTGINRVFKAELGGKEFIVKPETGLYDSEDQGPIRMNITPGRDLERERAAYIVSRYFEAVDPAFAVNTPLFRISAVREPGWEGGGFVRAGISSFVDDATVAKDLSAPWMDVASTEDIRRGAIFDAVIGNSDRHFGNFLVADEDAKLHLIDHGLAFTENNDSFANSFLVREVLANDAEALSESEVTFLTGLRSRWDQIEHDLRDLLPATDIGDPLEAMKIRVDYMIENRSLYPSV